MFINFYNLLKKQIKNNQSINIFRFNYLNSWQSQTSALLSFYINIGNKLRLMHSKTVFNDHILFYLHLIISASILILLVLGSL